MSDTKYSLIYHIVFSTKERFPSINKFFEKDLYNYIGAIIRNKEGILLEIGGTANHVHLALKLKPTHSIPDLLQAIKSNSSKWINENKKTVGLFSWQVGYGIFSISESLLPKVIDYIKNQKEHHRKRSFEEEFELLLNKHEIEYSPKYLWG